MFSILSDFIRNAGERLTLIVLDEDGLGHPRRYHVTPARLFAGIGIAVAVVAAITVIVVVATPVRGWFPGLATDEMRQEARLNAARLQTVEDSLSAQEAWLTHVRNLVLGRIDPGEGAGMPDLGRGTPFTGDLADMTAVPLSEDWQDHQQPALPVARMPADSMARLISVATAGDRFLSSLSFPMLPPVSGLLTRGFDARGGHYAIDVAVKEGTIVRAVGDGYVFLADWTHDGGHVIAIQHAEGFVSVYKHNRQLLKRAGDRVQDREPISLSGNTGEITTGPHVHFELWLDGLAQDPADYLIGL
jgi:murein DD-endopeptidase MepM/ murein hydrolase activator NlpD